MDAERQRLAGAGPAWKRWGAYLSPTGLVADFIARRPT